MTQWSGPGSASGRTRRGHPGLWGTPEQRLAHTVREQLPRQVRKVSAPDHRSAQVTLGQGRPVCAIDRVAVRSEAGTNILAGLLA